MKLMADIAPALNPGANPKAKFAVLKISKVPPDKTIGIPPPPISVGREIDAQLLLQIFDKLLQILASIQFHH